MEIQYYTNKNKNNDQEDVELELKVKNGTKTRSNSSATTTTDTPNPIIGVHASRKLSWLFAGLIFCAVALAAFSILDEYPLRREKAGVQIAVTPSELRVHNYAQDCWHVIHDEVYDFTSYVNEHPGGPAWISNFCGSDTTDLFLSFHNDAYLLTVANLRLGTLTPETPAPTKAPIPVQVPTKEPTFSPTKKGETRRPTPSPTTAIPTTPKCYRSQYSLEEIAQHDSADDCWYVLYDRVWDFTNYLRKHPGGSSTMIPWCGSEIAIQPFESVKKHDESLLDKKTPRYEIGSLGAFSAEIEIDC